MTVETLDSAQQAAATGTARIQLVLAGPGSGKTTALTSRFVHLVRQGTDRKRILALTFTKKAADEMKARIMQALDLESAAELTVATFHGFCFRHLRKNPQLAGLRAGFQLWDAPQQRQVFSSRRMWWNEDIDILDIIGGAKERLLDAAGFAAQIDRNDEVLGSAVDFFKVYENAIRAAGAIDFTDMVPLLARAMARDAAYGVTITGAYQHVLVDEYQDVNPGQIRLLDHFVNAGANLWVVGDDDQTLYAFRAADVRFIVDFPRKYRGSQVHVLDHNYRSATPIVTAAKHLIANNRTRRHKDYQPSVAHSGEIVIRGYRNPEIEARQVARAVAALIRRGHAPQRLAALYRTSTVGLALQPALQALGIPYEVRGGGDIWQGVAARLVVGSLYYLREGASDTAMSRMGSAKRADILRDQLDRATNEEKREFAAACRLVHECVTKAVPGRTSDRDRAEWTSVVDVVIALALTCRSLDELEARIEQQSSALRTPGADAVVLSTIHSAKGLEWDAVFMIGMEQGVLPHFNNDDLEEERRVAYVGVTRTKALLGLTYADERFGQVSRPSQFLLELAGRELRHCVWTDRQAKGADERLPLLSDRERQDLRDGRVAEDVRKDKAKVGSKTVRKGAPEHKRTRKRTAGARDRRAEKESKGLPARHGLAWSDNEDRRLRTRFLAGEAIAAIADAHQRKKGAINARLMKLGLVDEDGIPQHD